jgi:hypothetical protein
LRKLVFILSFILPFFVNAQYPADVDSVVINGSIRALIKRPHDTSGGKKFAVMYYLGGDGEIGNNVSISFNNGPLRWLRDLNSAAFLAVADSMYIVCPIHNSSAQAMEQPNNLFAVMDWMDAHHSNQDTTNQMIWGISQGGTNSIELLAWPVSLNGFGSGSNYRFNRVRIFSEASMCSLRGSNPFSRFAGKIARFYHGTSDGTCPVSVTNDAYDSVRTYSTNTRKVLLTGQGHTNVVWDSMTSPLGADSSTNLYKLLALQTSPPVNVPPVVNAGRDTILILHGGLASLVRTATATDPDGTISSYLWTKISGPGTQSIGGNTTATATITGIQAGTYSFKLLVTDNSGGQTSDTIQIIGNQPKKYVANATSGSMVIIPSITVSGTTPTSTLGLLPGDTLDLNPSGIYSGQQARGLHGTSTDHILVRGNGAYARSPKPTFQQTFWWDDYFVDFVGLKDSTWYGLHHSSYLVHDVTFDKYIGINGSSGTDTANFSTQPWWQWDDAFAPVGMHFSGNKDSTFYNIKYTNSRWRGFKDAGVITMGSGWGGGGQDNRSICLDWEFGKDTISDVINSGSGGSGTRITLISGTVWGANIHDLRIKDYLNPNFSYTHSHSVVVEIFGQMRYCNSAGENMFAQMYRLHPLSWTGLPGYAGTQITALAGLPNDGRKISSYQFNLIDHNKFAYSDGEVTQNGNGNRNSTNGINPTGDTAVHITVLSTRRVPDTGPYYGFIIDNVNQDSMFVADNFIMHPEYDFAYDTVTRSDYAVAIVSAAPPQLTKARNKPFPAWVNTITDDTVSFIPAIGSTIINSGYPYSFRTTDFYGNPISDGSPDVGAVERQTAGSPPNCTTNISPSNGSTIGTQTTANLSWNAATGSPTSYDVWIGGVFVTNVSGTSYSASGLIASTSYLWYVVPRNASGPALTCSGSAFTFTTAPIPVPGCASVIAPADGSTVSGTTTTPISWSSVATATSYDIYVYTGSLPGSPTANVSGTTYTAISLTPATTYNLLIVPRNGTGPATGCVNTTFTTASPVTPTYKQLLLYRN